MFYRKRTLSALKGIVPVLLCTILFGLAVRPVRAQETDPLTNRIQILYNDRNGLPTGEANTILQTRDGYVWIGGYGGLVRYDGNEFRNYSTEEVGLTSSGIRALFEDSWGNLWVGTNDKGVFLYDNKKFYACSMPEGERFLSIRCFAEDGSGTIYVGTSTGLARIGPDNKILPIEIDELEGQTIYSLSLDQNGALWGTAGSGALFTLKEGKLVYWLKPGALNENENYSVLARDDTIYVGTGGNALLRLTLTDDRYEPDSFRAGVYDTGPLNAINALCLTREGELWIGSNTGSGWFDIEHMNRKIRIPDHLEQNTFINCITQDYEGNLWMASTRGGVYELTKGKFLNANQAAGFAGKSINAVVRLEGLLYAASDYGLYIADKDWKPVHNALTRLLEGVRIRHLCADSSGGLWLSTYGDLALIHYTPETGEVTSITETDGLLDNKVRKAVELQNGDIAVATTSGINILHQGRVTQSYGRAQGIENPVILCLLQASDGTLLAGSDGMGIYVIKDGKAINLGKKQGLTSGVVLRMREDPKADGIWISAGSELYFMDSQGNITEITQFRYGIGSVFDIQVMEDDIWLMKSSGLIIVPRGALLGKQEMTAVQYGRESGLTANLTANSWNLFEDGTLYLCSVNGVFLLDNDKLPRNSIPPKTAISSVKVQREGGKITEYSNPEEITLPRDTMRVTIEFACLSYEGAPGTVEYYLENFDEQPIVISSDKVTAASYTNLHGGSYIFHLKARNADGVESESERTIVITKKLTFFEHPAVWVGLAVFAVLASLLVTKLVLELKTRQMKRRQQEYKEITDQALKTIANTIDAKDKYTKGHSARVAVYSLELARRLGLSGEEQERIYYIALLHDIGKIGIPDAILNKPGKLSDEEFEIMRSHARIGGTILKDFTALPQIADGALSHHENYDGTGYPDHKQGEDIPLVARIIRVADAYDAMATNRSYRNSMSREYIISEFRKYGGLQFESDIAQMMIEMISDGFTPDSPAPAFPAGTE